MLGLCVTKIVYWFGQCLFTACWVLFMCVGSGMAFMVFDVSIQEMNEMMDILQMTFWNAFRKRKLPCILKVSLKPLWPMDAIWWHGSESNFVQVTACCLMAPSHYLNRFWLIISKVLWHSYEDNFITDTSAIDHGIRLKITYEFHLNLHGANELTYAYMH